MCLSKLLSQRRIEEQRGTERRVASVEQWEKKVYKKTTHNMATSLIFHKLLLPFQFQMKQLVGSEIGVLRPFNVSLMRPFITEHDIWDWSGQGGAYR